MCLIRYTSVSYQYLHILHWTTINNWLICVIFHNSVQIDQLIHIFATVCQAPCFSVWCLHLNWCCWDNLLLYWCFQMFLWSWTVLELTVCSTTLNITDTCASERWTIYNHCDTGKSFLLFSLLWYCPDEVAFLTSLVIYRSHLLCLLYFTSVFYFFMISTHKHAI